MVCTIPKYTQYQLSQMVEQKLELKGLSFYDALGFYSVEEELLQEILNKQVRFKTKHYQLVSTITGYSIEELLEDEDIKPISFRSVHDDNDQIVIKEIEKISNFFKEVALLKKII